jgi:hypothetical protein
MAFRHEVSLSWAHLGARPDRGLAEALAIPERDYRLDALEALAAELPIELAIRACDAVLAEPADKGSARELNRHAALRALLKRLCDLGRCSDAWSLLEREERLICRSE